MWTDASKQARYSGGGWVSACGAYDWFKYGSRAARRPIDFLEGDTVVACVERLAHKWRGCVVRFFIDLYRDLYRDLYETHFFLLRKLATGAPMHRTVG